MRPKIQAIVAAILFGVSAPLAKLLLGEVQPVPLAALLYLGSGLGLLATRFVLQVFGRNSTVEAPITGRDLPAMLAVTMIGGVAAPIMLMLGLHHTPAATASLLLNFEAVVTALIAAIVFKEAIGRRIWLAIVCITAGGAILSVEVSGTWGLSLGAIGILAACVLWGTDNNITNTVSAKEPLAIVMIKSLGAGVFSSMLALALRNPLPHLDVALKTMVIGYFTYGLSIVLFVLSMRGLGAARAGMLFGTAPFVGAGVSLIIFRNLPSLQLIIAIPFMLAGASLMLSEVHRHEHVHLVTVHEHSHTHDDDHHRHEYDSGMASDEPHSHQHSHQTITHTHQHTPDMHHRHEHND